MPTLFRFLFLCATVVGIVYAVMLALVVFVTPHDRDVVVRIPTEKVNPPDH
ncbi:hypothetical protein [Rhizobium halophytocola]|uniref:Histidine kinase n=1 Tax=Rhizobium halophytocola TaxID=735519 RepID=A0ABS4E2P8_9HYPH|nr:hypothetical protein [Rhizobium halophytocola]MBP1852198.1 hypothetical protein [Rhizobium halophytocola]